MNSKGAGRAEVDRAELAERIERAVPRDGALEMQPGVFLKRVSLPGERVYAVSQPSFCVIARGSKMILLGDEVLRYDAAHYLISTMDLPLSGEVLEASPERPNLNFRMLLDPALVTSVIVESGHVRREGDGDTRAAAVSPLDDELLDATLRLVRLLDRPADYDVLAPLVKREIVYRLLAGAEGDRLHNLARNGGHGHRMARAVEYIRAHFDQPLRVEDVARELRTSVSTLHAHFKAATAMTPLRFQRHLRLQEARRLMLNDDLDAAEAGFRVGYEDASHFSREYKRHFGNPPKRDVENVRRDAGV